MTEQDAPSTMPPPGSPTSLMLGTIVTLLAVAVAVALTIGLGNRPNDATVEAAQRVLAQQAAPVSDQPATAATAPASPTPRPTSPPAPTPFPSPTPQPTATPLPTATPPPPLPTPQPTVSASTFAPRDLPAGRTMIQLATRTSFSLDVSRPAQLLPGHTAIYLDESFRGEVDLFVPYATAGGQRLNTFADVVDYLDTDPLFADLQHFGTFEAPQADVRMHFGFLPELQVGFYTAPGSYDIPDAGWRTPGRAELWLIDAPGGPVIMTAETLIADRDRADDVQQLLESLFDSLLFHPEN